MKLRSTSSAQKNFPDEITWITWKTKQDLEIWPLLNSLLEKWVWESGPKIDGATGVRLVVLPCHSDKVVLRKNQESEGQVKTTRHGTCVSQVLCVRYKTIDYFPQNTFDESLHYHHSPWDKNPCTNGSPAFCTPTSHRQRQRPTSCRSVLYGRKITV